MVGVDANRIFEVYTANTAVKTYLVGYTGQGVTFFTNAVSKATTTTGSYEDVDISFDTGSETALAGIFIMKNTSTSVYSYALNKKGSTDDFYYDMNKGAAAAYIIGLNASEVAQQKIENAALDLYLQGYVTGGAVLFTNATDKSTATTGSYVDVDITAHIGSDDANGAIVETFVTPDNTAREVAVRKNGASYDYYERSNHVSALVAIDTGDIFEQKISDVKRDLYLLGYTLDPGCDGTFQYRMPITVQAGQVSGGPHTNFPVLVNTTSTNLKSISSGGKVWNSNGYDIVFRGTDDTTCGGYLRSPCTLDHEIEKYDHTTGELVAWVRAPSIANGTVIYVYYGNCAVNSSTQHASAVWDSNYKGVWHLKESGNGTAGEYKDSTSLSNNGQGWFCRPILTQTTSGKIGNGGQDYWWQEYYFSVPKRRDVYNLDYSHHPFGMDLKPRTFGSGSDVRSGSFARKGMEHSNDNYQGWMITDSKANFMFKMGNDKPLILIRHGATFSRQITWYYPRCCYVGNPAGNASFTSMAFR